MNLGSNENRTVRQQERIGRRTSIIDDRRDTRAPGLETNANIRDARRGDTGGAEALMRTLGLLEGGISDFQKYATNQHIADEQDNIAQGAADEAAGLVDEEQMEKSLGYRNAVTKGRTVTAFSKATREFSQELEELIETQDSASLEERQAEIQTRLEDFYKDFAQDPETGELREFLQSPGAMRYLAEAIQTSRPKAMENAMARVETRFNREALSHFSDNITDQALDTGTVDLAHSLSLLPSTVTDEERSETALVALANASAALEAEGRFEEAHKLLAAVRGRFDTPQQAGEATSRPTGDPLPESVAGPFTPPSNPTEVEGLLRNPLGGRITSGFGPRGSVRGVPGASRNHNGLDIAAPVGTPVPAAMGGTVLRTWNHSRGGLSAKVQYDDGTIVGLAHLSEQTLKAGARFEAGATIALTGNTGKSSGPHLHYTVSQPDKNGKYRKVDPAKVTLGQGAPPDPRAKQKKAQQEALPTAPTTIGERRIPVGVSASGIETIDPDNPEGTQEVPKVRLSDPNADPFTRLEQSGEVPVIPGLEDVVFTPQQRARIDALYEQRTENMRREWTKANADRYSQNASTLALGVFGLDGKVTTMADIQRAYANDEIDDQAVMTLVRLHEGREDRRNAQAERAEARAEREERRRVERQSKAGAEALIGRMIQGGLSPAEARQAAIAVAGRVGDPEVAGNIIREVASVANGYENLIRDSAPVRDAMTEYQELAEDVGAYVEGMDIMPHRRKVAQEGIENIISRAQGRLMRRLMDGEDPAKAKEAVEKWFAQQEAALIKQLQPRTPSY